MTSPHDRATRSRRALLASATAAALATGLAAQTPTPVSPGSAAAAEALGGSCPAFSWSGVAGAEGYELVLYESGGDGALEVVFRTRVPGDARSWTPLASACPGAGLQFAWAVRALTEEGAGEWSEPLLFTTPGTPTEDEVRRALETVRRYREGDAGEEAVPEVGVFSTPARSLDGASRARVDPLAEPLTSTTLGDGSPTPATPGAGFYALSLDGDIGLGGAVFREGDPFLHNEGGDSHDNTALGIRALANVAPSVYGGVSNTAIGDSALSSNTTGFRNTAVGSNALYSDTTGTFNTAVGWNALFTNTTGGSNAAVGSTALYSNTTGLRNTAVGDDALFSNTTGSYNTAVGENTLAESTSGRYNTALGRAALRYLSSGNNNTAIGYGAGDHLTSGFANIFVGVGSDSGSASETGVIRIGGSGNQSKTFIEGIFGATASGGSQVFVNSSDQLGTATSSARFKQDIHDLEGVSDRLLALRPVSFRYRDELVGLEGEENPLEYGLIAEEVAETFPELVVHDEEGRPYTVRYHLLTPLLLAEILRLDHALRDRDRELVAFREEAVALRDEVVDLRRRLEALTDRGRGRPRRTSSPP